MHDVTDRGTPARPSRALDLRAIAALLALVGSLVGSAIATGSVAADADRTAPPPIRVACVGDSITEGTANADHAANAWPEILGRLLDARFHDAWTVSNFGRSGATLFADGRRPYMAQDVFEASKAFQPDVVVVNLGTNDAVDANWVASGPSAEEHFERDLRALLAAYDSLPSKPDIHLTTLTPMFARAASFEQCRPRRPIIEGIVRRVAAERGARVVDLTTPLADRPDLVPDGVHPNTAGNELIAQAVFEALTDRPAPFDSTIRPAGPVDEPLADDPTDDAAVLVRDGVAERAAATGWRAVTDEIAGPALEGTGNGRLLRAAVGVGAGDFHLHARLRLLDQRHSAAGFAIGPNFFGFEGAVGTVFRNGPQVGGLRLLHHAPLLWERDAWIDFDVVRRDGMVWFLVNDRVVDMAPIDGALDRLAFDPMRSRMRVASWWIEGDVVPIRPAHFDARTVATPWVDFTRRTDLDRGRVAGASINGGLPRTTTFRDAAGAWRRISTGADDALRLARSGDGGQSWDELGELPAILRGRAHVAIADPDRDRIVVCYRDTDPASPTSGDVVAWIGTGTDLDESREGIATVRLVALDDDAELVAPIEIERDDLDDASPLTVRVAHRSEASAPVTDHVTFTLADVEAALPTRAHALPLVDLDGDADRHVVVDREPGQYLGHVTTELLGDGETIIAVYPKGHGRGEIVMKRSPDGGRTWSERLPTPANWSTSREVPTIHRVVDPVTGAHRLILWSGLRPARIASSEDEGATWSELEPVGDWGGIVVMGFVETLRDGRLLAMFHDDGRFIGADARRTDPPTFTLYQTLSADGGRTWSDPTVVWSGTDVHLCEPGCIRSPDGRTLAVLLRENSRTRNSFVIFSDDEGATWSAPRELPAALTGDRHTPVYAPDGRIFISFRDTTLESPTQGDWVGWVGTWEDIRDGRPGQYRVRFKDNRHRWDTTYPGVEVMPDGTIVVTTYGHWDDGEEPYILSARVTLAELDERARTVRAERDSE